MRKLFLLAAVAVLTVSFAYAAAPAKVVPTATRVKGTVDKVDTTAHTLTVTVGTASKTFTYNEKTTVFMSHKKAKIDDLKAGDKVSLSHDAKDYLRSVMIESAPAAPPAK
jgi:Cu/Ag efflux protein CusF